MINKWATSNHLGNVLVTISDRKLQLTETNTGEENNGGCEIGTGVDVLDVATRNGESNYTAITTVNLLPGFESNSGDDYAAYVDNSLTTCVPLTVPTQGWYYAADVVGANDYYPFGMLMPGRKFSSGAYRYGFNGQEQSTEIDPVGNSNTAEFWQYDARLGRRWNLDPRSSVDISPYATFANNPIYNADPIGDTILNGEFHENNKNGGELSGVTVRSSIPKEGSIKVQTKPTFNGGTGGGAISLNPTNYYYHRSSEVYNTKAGWYEQGDYINELKRSGIAIDFGSAFPEAVKPYPPLPRSGAGIKLQAFMSHVGIPADGFYQNLGIAAGEASVEQAKARSGYTEFASVNIEDLLFVGTLVKDMLVGYAGAQYLRLGYRFYGSDFLRLESRLTLIGEADIRGLGFGQFDIAHRATTFLESEIIKNGKITVRKWNEVNFQIINGGRKFSISGNPWTRRIWHFGPNQ